MLNKKTGKRLYRFKQIGKPLNTKDAIVVHFYHRNYLTNIIMNRTTILKNVLFQFQVKWVEQQKVHKRVKRDFLSGNNIPNSASKNSPKFADEMWINQWYFVSIYCSFENLKRWKQFANLEVLLRVLILMWRDIFIKDTHSSHVKKSQRLLNRGFYVIFTGFFFKYLLFQANWNCYFWQMEMMPLLFHTPAAICGHRQQPPDNRWRQCQ